VSMNFGSMGPLSDIPFLTKADLSGRFLASTLFYDGNEWQMWLQTEQADSFVKVHAWPAESFYFSAQPENENDLCSDFLNFLAQSANMRPVMRQFSAIGDDIFNLSASLAKLPIFHSASTVSHGSSRLAATEVEYILFICRSLFDLLQEAIKTLWESVLLSDTTVRKNALSKSFADMALHGDEIRTAADIAEKYGLPMPLAECYVGHAPMFLKIRQFRDDLVHRGHRVQTIFRGDTGFLITNRLGSFRDINIWRETEVIENGLAPLAPVLNLIIHGTLAACEDFAITLSRSIKWFEPTVPGMKLHMRGYFVENLRHALADADSRLAEGRSLVTGMQHSPAAP
jgi:hypothetical protein